jgi:crotonobetainyl-CoA:carnitine CoA-transferase CaiB-like acyl-CoA transferase
MTGPLEGVRALELAEGVCGPYAAMQLADAGCEVIKVEPLAGDYSRTVGPPFVEGESALFLALNRNKQSIAVDFDHPEGQAIVKRLAQAADVVLDGLGPGEAGRRQLDFPTLAALNPRLVYASISPFGESGPLSDRPGAELIVQALSDYTASLGALGAAPVRLGADVAAINTAVVTVQAIVAALFQRARTGRGQAVATSMLGTLLHLRGILWTALNDPDDWVGINLDTYVRPPDHGYSTKDVPIQFSLGRGNTEDWYHLLFQLNMLDVIDDPRFDDFGRESVSVGRFGPEVKDKWEAAFQEMTAAEVTELIRRSKGNTVPFNNYEMLSAHPQVAELGIVIDIPLAGETTGMKGIGAPYDFSGTPLSPQRSAPPRLGEHTTEILVALGYTAAEISRLQGMGVIHS